MKFENKEAVPTPFDDAVTNTNERTVLGLNRQPDNMLLKFCFIPADGGPDPGILVLDRANEGGVQPLVRDYIGANSINAIWGACYVVPWAPGDAASVVHFPQGIDPDTQADITAILTNVNYVDPERPLACAYDTINQVTVDLAAPLAWFNELPDFGDENPGDGNHDGDHHGDHHGEHGGHHHEGDHDHEGGSDHEHGEGGDENPGDNGGDLGGDGDGGGGGEGGGGE